MFAAPLVAALIRLTAALPGGPAVSTALLPGSTSPTPSGTPTAGPTPDPTGTSFFDGVKSVVTDVASAPASNTMACDRDDVSVCGVTVRITGNEHLGKVLEVLLGTPLQIAFIVVIGILIRKILHRLIDRLAQRIATGSGFHERNGNGNAAPRTGGGTAGPAAAPPITRRLARSRTLAQVLRSVTSVLVVIVVALMVLQELGVPITPLLASFSVVGVALGLGAQSVVRDVIAGMFMILEDQYGVGDTIDAGEASGTVEAVGLRVTQLRDLNGTVWYVRNGEILRVGNKSQGWSRAVLDVNIGYEENIDHVEEVLRQVAAELRAEPEYGAVIMEDPEVWGVEALAQDSLVVRMVIKTYPDQSGPVAREMRRRIRLRFEREGIFMHTTPRTLIVNQGEVAPPLGSDDAPLTQDRPAGPADHQDDGPLGR